jgi:hypothetical protein
MKNPQLFMLAGTLCMVILALAYQARAQVPGVGFQPAQVEGFFSIQNGSSSKSQTSIPKNWRWLVSVTTQGNTALLWFQDPDGNVFLLRTTVYGDALSVAKSGIRIDSK